MTCSQCKYEWCWICGRDWRNLNHYGDSKFSLIHCNTFGYLPDTRCRKFRYYLYLIALILFSPIISIVLFVGFFFKATRMHRLAYFNESDSNICCILINILFLPWNILILSIGAALGIVIGCITMIFFVPKFIYENCKGFKIIIGYWSKKNRFRGEGPVKVELIEAAKRQPALPPRRYW